MNLDWSKFAFNMQEQLLVGLNYMTTICKSAGKPTYKHNFIGLTNQYFTAYCILAILCIPNLTCLVLNQCTSLAREALMRSPINVLKHQPPLPLIQYCLCLLQSIACNLGHGRLRVTAVIMRKPHNCDFACFSCFHLI